MTILTEEQEMLRSIARQWTAKASPVRAWRQVRDRGDPRAFDPVALGAMADMGWTGIVIPERFGGSDFGWRSLGLVIEETARTLTASPIAASAIAASAILLGGSEEQQALHLPRIASGNLIAAMAVDEGPRHDPDGVVTRVEAGRLTGMKLFVAEGDSAGLFVVAATDGLYLVEAGEAVERHSRRLIDARSHADIRFTDAPAIPLAGGTALLHDVLDRARIVTAAEMLGLAGQAFDTTLDYLKQRVQFGQVLATFQALQHRMSALFTQIELMRSAVEAGLAALDSGTDVHASALVAKAKANEALHLMSREMIQLHGGIGMTDEHDAGFYLKRARVLEASWGNTAWLRDRYAAHAGF